MASETSRPLLLPQNRKLRHLQGIYLRNLSFSRPRGHTIDDAALNKKSPQKLEALREPQLHHASSSGNLRPTRPRRTSTMWSTAGSGFRQKKLEDVIDTRMADTFFTLHCAGQDEPIYISEVVGKAMNPTFRFFDLSAFGPATTRLNKVTIKIWVKRQEFVLLIEEDVNLQSLQFIGTLENHPFPLNCILFRLIDGIYAVDTSSKPPNPKPAPTLPTSSYSALMRLSNLDDSIQDALATRKELTTQITALLESKSVDEAPQAREEAALASRYVTAERKQLKASIRRRTELKASIVARSSAITSGEEAQLRASEDINHAQIKLANSRSLHATSTTDIHQQRRRICEELLNVFPIEPTSHPLLFTICGLPLPNSTYDSADEDVVAAALGHVAYLTNALQYYLGVPLPYPTTPYGSRSLIQDPISILSDNQRVFPLFPKSTISFRFEYGVFLLNKDIECLAESQGLKVVDIRQTLPNLKYLLYVCSAGSSDLPARKAGGVRGLLAGRTNSGLTTGTIPSGSRRGSTDSGVGEQARRALEDGQVETKVGGKLGNMLSLPFAGNHVHSLRTSGLRENVKG